MTGAEEVGLSFGISENLHVSYSLVVNTVMMYGVRTFSLGDCGIR